MQVWNPLESFPTNSGPAKKVLKKCPHWFFSRSLRKTHEDNKNSHFRNLFTLRKVPEGPRKSNLVGLNNEWSKRRKLVEKRGEMTKKSQKNILLLGIFCQQKSPVHYIFSSPHTVTTLIFESTHSVVKLILWWFWMLDLSNSGHQWVLQDMKYAIVLKMMKTFWV